MRGNRELRYNNPESNAGVPFDAKPFRKGTEAVQRYGEQVTEPRHVKYEIAESKLADLFQIFDQLPEDLRSQIIQDVAAIPEEPGKDEETYEKRITVAQNWFDKLKDEGRLVKEEGMSAYHYQAEEKAEQPKRAEVQTESLPAQQSGRVSNRRYYGTGKAALMRFYERGKSFEVSSSRNYGRKPRYKDPSTHRSPPIEGSGTDLSAAA